MRYQNGIIGIVGLVLATVMAAGAVVSEQFPQASQAQAVGFDALAHELLDDLFSSNEQPKGPAK